MERQIKNLYDSTDIHKRANELKVEMLGKEVKYLHAEYSRHVMLINDNTEYGKKYNTQILKMLKIWIMSCCFSCTSHNLFASFFGIVRKSFNSQNEELTHDGLVKIEDIFHCDSGLTVRRNDDKTKLLLTCYAPRLDNALVQLTNFEPPYDIIEHEEEYTIIIDVPGVTVAA
jgi:hypothetical protein